MKATESAIKSSGLTVLYDPDDTVDAVVDIVLVHGIGGHAVHTWKWRGRRDARPAVQSAKSTAFVRTGSIKKLLRNPPLRRSHSEPLLGRKQDSTGRSRNVLRKNALQSSSRLRLDELGRERDTARAHKSEVYWPLDLLPHSCPASRVVVWGYHTLVVDGKPLRLQHDVFAHARDLLADLADMRDATHTTGRPIVFIAHSTGGVVVKELLRLSEIEEDGPARRVLLSTAAVVFLGSPHRASERSRLGDAVRSMASLTLRVDADDVGLRELSGSANPMLELGRQAFVKLWNDFNFKVKTFQESMAHGARSRDARAEAFFRRQSSFLGSPREGAETIHASHLEMCRFGSAEDGGYRSLVAALQTYIHSEASKRNTITNRELECLAALARPDFSLYDTHPATTYPGTCLWLYDLPEFRAWHHRIGRSKSKVLWLKGPSGSGKSVLLRSLRNRIERQWRPAGAAVLWTLAGGGQDTSSLFFPGSCRPHNATDPSGVYRSLLAQLFLRDPRLRRDLLALYDARGPRSFEDAVVVSFFAEDYVTQRRETTTRRTFIFVDVSDDCGLAYLRDLLSSLARLARNSDFSICVASGEPVGVGVGEESGGAIDVVMHVRGADDILRYVNLNLVAEWEERNRTVVRIGQKAGGVFLWAEIVVNILNAAIGEGASPDAIESTLEEMPGDLHGLYEWMLRTLNDAERAEALVLFQWVILAAEPLRLNDLLMAYRVTRTWPYERFRPALALQHDTPSSLRDLPAIRNSEVASDAPHQYHRWIRHRSIGLLEMRRSEGRDGVLQEPWGLQRVQVTHDSVRTFFLYGRGFACLWGGAVPPSCPTEDLIDRAHYALLHACLSYLNMRDFEHLGHHHHYHRYQQQQQQQHVTGQDGSPVAVAAEGEEGAWQRNAYDQRHLVMSSYPFLQYAVRHLLFHLLAPRPFRYFPPQGLLLRAFAANRCRLWRRWTSLLGTSADPEAVLAGHDDADAAGPVRMLLSPVFGSRYRLLRVFRKLARMTAALEAAQGRQQQQQQRAHHRRGGGGGGVGDGSGSSAVFSPILPVGPMEEGQVTTPRSASSDKTLWSPSARSPRSPKSAKGLLSPLGRSLAKDQFFLGTQALDECTDGW